MYDRDLQPPLWRGPGVGLLFAFLPFVLVAAIEPSLVWRLGSGLLAIYTVGITILRVRQASLARIRAAIGMRVAPMAAQVVVVGALLANALWLGSSSLYVVDVLYSLGIAFSCSSPCSSTPGGSLQTRRTCPVDGRKRRFEHAA